MPLDRLYLALGAPRWFYPSILLLIFLMWGLAGSLAPEIER